MAATNTTKNMDPMNLKVDGLEWLDARCLCRWDRRLLKLSLLTYLSSFMLSPYSESIVTNDSFNDI